TPTGITEGERCFEHAKRCYLTEVMPFFKLLKEHFEGLYTALKAEIKEMEVVFKDMENEVNEYAIELKSREIEKKTYSLLTTT
ncbi:MAG TPA: hypothetical protein VNB67_05055, partial [Nitrososphaeraceae archaeon]|nr:hypothetical protein [Nitrososphaeraceae archaeon]